MGSFAVEHIEGELLGNGASAAVFSEFEDGAEDGFTVDAGMLVKAIVFGGDQGVDDVGGDIFIVGVETVAFGSIELAHGNFVCGEDFGGQYKGWVLEFLDGGECAEGAFGDTDDEDDKAQEAGEEKYPEDANGFAHSILIVRISLVGCRFFESDTKLTLKNGN